MNSDKFNPKKGFDMIDTMNNRGWEMLLSILDSYQKIWLG
jgi:hypothetical protein